MRALLLWAAFAGCTKTTDLLPKPDGGTCMLPGPPVQLTPDSPCAGALAAKLLRYSLCSCSALLLPRGLFTEGGSPMREPVPPAAVGTDDYLVVGGPVQVAGALEAAGIDGAGFNHTAGVLGTLRSGGSVRANQYLSVGGDAFVAGDVLGRVDVAGLLHVPDGANLGPSVSASDLVREPVAVNPPCDCDAAAIDAGALVMARAGTNDDGTIGLHPDDFASTSGPAKLELSCGQFFLSQLNANDSFELIVHGRAALFVGGDLTLANGLDVTLDPEAELDLIVAGDLELDAGNLGALTAEHVRLWLGSTVIKLGPDATLSAAVYAPNATLLADGDLSARGALFLGALSLPGDLSVHYDADLLSGGVECGEMPQPPVQ